MSKITLGDKKKYIGKELTNIQICIGKGCAIIAQKELKQRKKLKRGRNVEIGEGGRVEHLPWPVESHNKS